MTRNFRLVAYGANTFLPTLAECIKAAAYLHPDTLVSVYDGHGKRIIGNAAASSILQLSRSKLATHRRTRAQHRRHR